MSLCHCGNVGVYKTVGLYICHDCYWDQVFNKSIENDARLITLTHHAEDKTLPLYLQDKIKDELDRYQKGAPNTYVTDVGEVIRKCENCFRFIKAGRCNMFGYRPVCYRCCADDAISKRRSRSVTNDACGSNIRCPLESH